MKLFTHWSHSQSRTVTDGGAEGRIGPLAS